MSVKIGVHNANLHLLLSSRWPGLFDDLSVEFVQYEDGRQSDRFLRNGQIDICGTGSTPPIIAQANGDHVEYIAASSHRPGNGALVTLPDSPLTGASDLAGKRIALVDGSFHTYLLARILDEAGLTLRDVQRIELSPSASLNQLLDHKVDAWIAMAPMLEKATSQGIVRILASCGSTIPNRSVFWTLKERGLSPEIRDAVVQRLMRLGELVAADPQQAAHLLTEARAEQVNMDVWAKAVAARDWEIIRANALVAAEQQAEADTLVRHGDLQKTINVLSAFPN